MSYLISVILPTFNRKEFLNSAIQSVISQTYSNWELIIVDDGSTDATQAVVEGFLRYDPRIRYFYQSNCGPSSARNFGLEVGTGQFVTFLDSDDYFHPRKLEAQIEALLNGDLDFVICGSTILNDVEILGYKKPLKVDNLSKSLLSLEFNGLAGTPLLFVRKDLIDKFIIKFDLELCAMEDWDFLFQLSTHSRNFSVISDFLYFEVKHSNFHVNTFKSKFRAIIHILNKYRCIFSQNDRLSLVWQLRAIRYYIYYLFNDGDEYSFESISCKFRLKSILFFNLVFHNNQFLMRIVIKLFFLDLFLYKRD